MKIKRASSSDKVELNMTPMIDIVFQLMTFFLFSIKTVSTEGSFDIRIPVRMQNTPKPLDEPNKLKTLTLRADPRGWLTSAVFLGQKYTVPPPANPPAGKDQAERKDFTHSAQTFQAIHQQVLALVGNTSGPGKGNTEEIEIDCSPNLKYHYVIQAIDAISGHRQKDGTVIPLIEKFRLKPQTK